MSLWWAAAACAAVALYYLIAWYRVGRDPRAGTIIPEFSAPEGIGPAGIRYIHRMEFDRDCLSVAILNMAVKGFLTIEEADGEFTLRRRPGGDKALLTRAERIIADRLLTTDQFTIARAGHVQLAAAMDALKRWLKLEYEGRVFRANRRWVTPGVLLSFGAPLVVSLSGPEPIVAFTLAVWLSMFGVGMVALLQLAIVSGRDALQLRGKPRIVAAALAVFLAWFSLPFVGAVVTGLLMLNESGGTGAVALLLALIPLNLIFVRAMRAPTVGGRVLVNRIEGLRRYLSVAEADRVGAMQGPVMTPQHAEQLMPYAIALGVQNSWATQFAFELTAASLFTESRPHAGSSTGGSLPFVNTSAFVSAIGASTTPTIDTSSSLPPRVAIM
jgi:hypothetical protein